MAKISTKKKSPVKNGGSPKKSIQKKKTLKVAVNGKAKKTSKPSGGSSLQFTKSFKVYKNQKDHFLDNKKF